MFVKVSRYDVLHTHVFEEVRLRVSLQLVQLLAATEQVRHVTLQAAQVETPAS